MKKAIHPETIKALREKRNWSQEQLAEHLKCTVTTISRWERGKTTNLRPRSIKQLQRVFNIGDEILFQPPIKDGAEEQGSPTQKEQLNIRIDPAVRTALQLVCQRYKVRPSQVIELAPLLFLITAEKSLQQRKDALEAMYDRLENASTESQNAAPHLSPALYFGHWDDALIDEEQSIKSRDVFGEKSSWDVEDFCPYTNYLNDLKGSIPLDVVGYISPSYSYRPEYQIALDTLMDITGISGESERDQKIRNYIMIGHMDLREIITQKRGLPENEYQAWLDKEYEQAMQDAEEGLAALLNGLEFDLDDLNLAQSEEA